MKERISRKDERPCYQPAITPEACHLLWQLGQSWGVPMTVVLDRIIHWTAIAEEARQEDKKEGKQSVEISAEQYERLLKIGLRTGVSPATLLGMAVEGFIRQTEKWPGRADNEYASRPEFPKTYAIVGWVYEADLHCNACARARFGCGLEESKELVDREGNPVHPVFLGDLKGDEVCGDCFARLGDSAWNL